MKMVYWVRMDIAVLGVYFGLFIALYFEVFLLISYLEKRPAEKNSGMPSYFPSVTMIVPCFNEVRTLGQTVQSLLELQYPKEKVSIVIVDDGSTDGTRALGEALAVRHAQVAFFHKENGGKYTALNLGIERATSDLIGCLDADSFVAPDAMLEVAKRLEDDSAIMAIAPAMQVYRPRTALELMQAVEYTFGIFYKKMFDNLSALNVLPGPFSIYKREVFARIGLFRHAHNTEDMEIAFRMHSYGLKIANAHTAHVYTIVPQTVAKLIKQRTRWSQGFLQNSMDYWYMYFNRRFGNFGMLILPFSLLSFAAGLYMAGYSVFRFASAIADKTSNLFGTGIPLQVPTITLNWFYLNTSMMLFLIITTLCMTALAVVLGQRIANNKLGPASLVYYFALFGLVAPVWLARAAWGALSSSESAWR